MDCAAAGPSSQVAAGGGSSGSDGDWRLVESLTATICEVRGLRVSSSRGVAAAGSSHRNAQRLVCIVRLDADELYQSCSAPKAANTTFGNEVTLQIKRPFRQLHFVLCDYAAGRPARPLARATFAKRELHKLPTADVWRHLAPYSAGARTADVSGKIRLQLVLEDGPAGRKASGGGDASPQHRRLAVRVPEVSDVCASSAGGGADDLYAIVTLCRLSAADAGGSKQLAAAKLKVPHRSGRAEAAAAQAQHGGGGGGEANVAYLDVALVNDTQPNVEHCVRVALWSDSSFFHTDHSYFHGEVRVPLENSSGRPVRTGNGGGGGETLDAWYCLKPRGQTASSDAHHQRARSNHVGSLHLKIHYRLDYVLNGEHYGPLVRNLLDGIALASKQPTSFPLTLIGIVDAIPRVDCECAARSLICLALYTDTARQLVRTACANDIAAKLDVNTIFRSTTVATKLIAELMRLVGRHYLQVTLRPALDRLYNERRDCELDPGHLAPGHDLRTNTENLVEYVDLILSRVTDSSHRCPPIMKEVFADVRDVAVARFPQRAEASRLAVSSFVVMRFFAAAIIDPQRHNIKRDYGDACVRRALNLCGKVLQHVSNRAVQFAAARGDAGQTAAGATSATGSPSREPWLAPVLAHFSSERHVCAMVKFLDRVSAPQAESSVSADSVTTLKEGHVSERVARRKRCFRFMCGNATLRPRLLLLTENELLVMKAKQSVRWRVPAGGGLLQCALSTAAQRGRQLADYPLYRSAPASLPAFRAHSHFATTRHSRSYTSHMGAADVDADAQHALAAAGRPADNLVARVPLCHVDEVEQLSADDSSRPFGNSTSRHVLKVTYSPPPTPAATEQHDAEQQGADKVDTGAAATGAVLYLQAPSACELQDWHSAIERQRQRVLSSAASSSRDADASAHRLSVLADIDVPKECESLRTLLMDHAHTMLMWKNQLDGDDPSNSDGVQREAERGQCESTAADESAGAPLPSVCASQPHRAAFHSALMGLLAVLFSLERAHRRALHDAVMRMRAGSKEHPIGDDNYLLLKSRLGDLIDKPAAQPQTLPQPQPHHQL